MKLTTYYFIALSYLTLALFPGPAQLSVTSLQYGNFLHSCEIKSGSGLGTRLNLTHLSITKLYICPPIGLLSATHRSQALMYRNETNAGSGFYIPVPTRGTCVGVSRLNICIHV